MMRDEVQSVDMVNGDRDKEKVAYRSSGRMVKDIVDASEVKPMRLTRLESSEEAEGGPR